ncbi:uncharacterized protein Z518_03540 [Rhinocladiella mackenziei CBS 650.93]|uniref:Rhinocladiella mackenziei CBS 650.93 unplaced genomic scaffold supercont1.2, whole genome shotgun sequence n=1 Tax=Rhinocladiella mackenziei CBS 650.93 TaxID=1442369 RepID=A0A0D2HE85_9EURO|nr:uncharacterized protein Z518_03540 [Rhinocladiella mackenziei CBS 650.93]KIX08883.1 hypothetical protein Z518_03540 [Rhinocladiella mackenziei CBS 650.93]
MNASKLFDPARHLAYQRPTAIHTLEDFHLPPSPISPIASTEPFPLLSEEAILQHRRELFSKDVLDNCLYYTRPGSVQLRGMAPRYTPFIYQFWTSPEVLKIVSELAGVDLVPVMDYEICHTNVQLGPDGIEGVRHTPIVPPQAPEDTTEGASTNLTKVGGAVKPAKEAIVPWHRDSHPFVCVVMLSDARYMTDGETEIQCGDGRTTKVRSPQMGGAVILQGRQISHIAIPAGNMPERITIVCSFRPRSPELLDDSSNMNVRTKSRLPELYYQWTSYRLHLLSRRFRIEADKLDAKYQKTIEETDSGKPGDCRDDIVDVEKLGQWMDAQIRYMKQTLYEMREVTPEDNINKNEIPNVQF